MKLETKYILHLEDREEDQHHFKVLFDQELKDTLLKFFREYFKHDSAKEPFYPNLDFQLLQYSSVEACYEALYQQGRLTPEGSNVLLFVLDYYLDQDKQKTFYDYYIKKIAFPEWLHTQFSAIPKVILTVGDVNDIFNHHGFIYKNKDSLMNSTDIRIWRKYFAEWWYPSFSDALWRYASEKGNDSWHTPGHNGGNAFFRSNFQRDFYDKYGSLIFQTDLSVSVDSMGDLSEPDLASPLKNSRNRTRDIFGAEETYYITNGSSTSNKAMLMSFLREGDIVLLDRNCHKSVHQSIVMAGARPLYLAPTFNQKLGIWTPLTLSELRTAIEKTYPTGAKPKMLILTTCTYEGILYPIPQIASICEENGILFLADEAWAPYLRFHPYYSSSERALFSSAPELEDMIGPVSQTICQYNATDGGAHIVVHSTHKTLAAFSQASMIHLTPSFKRLFDKLNDSSQESEWQEDWKWLKQRFEIDGKASFARFRHEISEVLRYWHSTSPHYPMLASLDRAAIQMRLEGLELLNARLEWVEKFRSDLERDGKRRVLMLSDIVENTADYTGYQLDPLKLLIAFKDAESGKKLLRILQENHIQWEKSTAGCVQFLVTIGTFQSHLQSLLNVLSHHLELMEVPAHKTSADFSSVLAEGQIEVLPRSAVLCEGEMVEISNSEGRICAQMLVPYPPGIPLFLPGYRISQVMIKQILQTIEQHGVHAVHGVYETNNRYYLRVMRLDEVNESLARTTKQF